MARIRSIKPELRESRVVATWPWEIRYFWVLFWGYLDDSGRGNDMPKRIAGDCYPLDDIDAKDIDAWLDLMTKGIDDRPGPVCRYEVEGRRFVHALNWSEHQRPNRPTKSRIPPCPFHEGLSESLNGSSVPGAAEQGSRGAEEQQQTRSEPLTESVAITQAANLIIEATGVTRDLAVEVVLAVDRERKPRNLPGLIRSLIAADDIGPWFLKAEKAITSDAVKLAIHQARASPECAHGEPGGDLSHPVSGQPFCPQCRRGIAA